MLDKNKIKGETGTNNDRIQTTTMEGISISTSDDAPLQEAGPPVKRIKVSASDPTREGRTKDEVRLN